MSSVTAAVIYRVIEQRHPTLLIDEVDSFLSLHEEMRGILNSGHQRDGARVLRSVGDEHEPRDFSTWCPKVLALIGALPSTLDDRSIIVSMRRKTPTERVERLTPAKRRRLRTETTGPLTRQALRWAEDHLEVLIHGEDFSGTPDVALPDDLDDRAQDNWEPLFAIADVIGGDWPDRARTAALALSGPTSRPPDASLGLRLLSTIRSLLEEKFAGQRTVFTEHLLLHLAPLDAFKSRAGKSIDSTGLADVLRPFKIAPGTVRQGEQNRKGYYRADFEDAFERYLSKPETSEMAQSQNDEPSHPSQPNRHAPKHADTGPSQRENVTGPQIDESPHKHWGVTDVTGKSPETPPRPSTKQPVTEVTESRKRPVTESRKQPVTE
jgi:putative DNA primase/helicase